MGVPVYLFTGFMDSGKTSLIEDTIFNSGFTEGNKTLIISCEEGDVEYDEKRLKDYNVSLEWITEKEDFTPQRLLSLYEMYLPDYIFIEFNGTWEISVITDLEMPDEWEVVQVLTTVEGPTFDMYLKNMRTMMMEQMLISDVVIVNRSTDNLPKTRLRAAIKGFNKKTQIVYERPDGTIDEEAMNALPFDKNQDVLDLTDDQYAAFYMDVMDHPKDYNGKTVKFRALVYKPDNYRRPGYVPGRFAMTCCVEDIQFLGLPCRSKNASSIGHKSWVDVTAKIKYEFARDYNGRGPILYETDVKPAPEPQDPLVYFT